MKLCCILHLYILLLVSEIDSSRPNLSFCYAPPLGTFLRKSWLNLYFFFLNLCSFGICALVPQTKPERNLFCAHSCAPNWVAFCPCLASQWRREGRQRHRPPSQVAPCRQTATRGAPGWGRDGVLRRAAVQPGHPSLQTATHLCLWKIMAMPFWIF